MPSRTSIATTFAAAALTGAAVLAGAAPAGASVVDPGAFGIFATGPTRIATQPSVSWTSGDSLTVASPGLRDGALSVGAMAVAAGQGHAAARVADLRYADTVRVSSLIAACFGGRTTVSVTGTAAGRILRPGQRIALSGGYAEVGERTANPDGTVTVTGLIVVDGTEALTAAVARC
jgi:hypothetical protein